MRRYQYWLSNISGIGNQTIHKLLQMAECAEQIYFLKKEQLQLIYEMTELQVEEILLSKKNWDLDEQYEKLLEKGISFYCEENDNYPEKLRTIHDSPYSFYCKGRLPDQNEKLIAIVGARRCSEYGRAVALELGEKLANANVGVISGMALGIDSCGHWGAIKGKGRTYAVLGSGADECYPRTNRDLYQKILECGGVVSEYPPGTLPIAKLFPARNRLISAFSDATIVVEARKKSGSLITADFALDQGKDIFAVPGGIYDELSSGCNCLIRQGAGIISSVDEFLQEMDFLKPQEIYQTNFRKLLLEKDETLVYSCVDLRPKSIEELLLQTGLPLQEMVRILAKLQQMNLLEESFKNYYIRRN